MIVLKDAVFVSVSSPVAGAAVDCGRTLLDSVLVRDSLGNAVAPSHYSATADELAAGVIHWANPLGTASNLPWQVIHSKSVLPLSSGLFWRDRHEWQGGLSQMETPTSGGAVVIQSYKMLAGRKISLEPPSNDVGLMSYADLQTLDGLASTDGTRFVLRVGGADYLVQFRRPAFVANPAVPKGESNFRDVERWLVSINFLTV